MDVFLRLYSQKSDEQHLHPRVLLGQTSGMSCLLNLGQLAVWCFPGSSAEPLPKHTASCALATPRGLCSDPFGSASPDRQGRHCRSLRDACIVDALPRHKGVPPFVPAPDWNAALVSLPTVDVMPIQGLILLSGSHPECGYRGCGQGGLAVTNETHLESAGRWKKHHIVTIATRRP
jgi:hypothetical protein